MYADMVLRGLLDERLYLPTELPPHAYGLTAYLEYRWRCHDGGHNAVEGSPSRDPEAWHAASDFLGHLGQWERKALLDDFIRFSRRNRLRLRLMDWMERGTWPLFVKLDERLPSNEEDRQFMAELKAWLLRQDWLVIDEALTNPTSYQIRALMPVHPQAEQRMRARWGDDFASKPGLRQRYLRARGLV